MLLVENDSSSNPHKIEAESIVGKMSLSNITLKILIAASQLYVFVPMDSLSYVCLKFIIVFAALWKSQS